jgi:hypothetical protein
VSALAWLRIQNEGGGGLEDKGKRTMVGNMESIVKVQNALWNKKGTQKNTFNLMIEQMHISLN